MCAKWRRLGIPESSVWKHGSLKGNWTISRHIIRCSLSRITAAARGEGDLPPNACALTFDDGLADHYTTVFPRLLERRLTAAFFPPAGPVVEHRVLDVHKIHFLLAAAPDHARLSLELLSELAAYRTSFDIPPDSVLLRQFAAATRFDPAEVVFIKRLLQWGLPPPVRSSLIEYLFARHVSKDQSGFAQELYLQIGNLREMASSGMEIGGHGYNHVWLGKEPFETQSDEISRTVAFLTTIFGHQPTGWVMCYPYGSYNADTLKLVSSVGCTVGLTTMVGLADLGRPLELQRLDTNDLPTVANADVCQWTSAVS